jgi:hypothetical protein
LISSSDEFVLGTKLGSGDSSFRNFQSTEQFLSYLTLLLDVTEGRDWARFDAVAVQHPRAFRAVSDKITTVEAINGMSFLHTIERNDPSPRVHESAVDMMRTSMG